VRVSKENVLGSVNDGWNVAVSTLMYERGSYGARLHLIFRRNIAGSSSWRTRFRETARGGTGSSDSPENSRNVTPKIESSLESDAAFSRITATGVPGPEGSIQKIFWRN